MIRGFLVCIVIWVPIWVTIDLYMSHHWPGSQGAACFFGAVSWCGALVYMWLRAWMEEW